MLCHPSGDGLREDVVQVLLAISPSACSGLVYCLLGEGSGLVPIRCEDKDLTGTWRAVNFKYNHAGIRVYELGSGEGRPGVLSSMPNKEEHEVSWR